MVTIASALSAQHFQRPPEDLYSDQEAPGPRIDKDTCLEIAGLFIVFAEFPGVYKAGRTMVLMEDEDILRTKSSIFSSIHVEPFSMSKSLYIPLHECRALFHSSLPRIMCEDMHDSSAIPNHASSGLRLQIAKGFRAWMVKFTGG